MVLQLCGVSKTFCTLSRNSSTKVIAVNKLSGITCLSFDRPETKNSFNAHLLTQLEEEIDRFEADSDSKVAVLHGERGNFSYGYDSDEIKLNLRLLEEADSVLRRLLGRFCKKPIVAGINGYAIGPAMDLAVWCDFRIVEDTAVLACYARSFGHPISEQSARHLVSAVGINRALDWVSTGRPVKPKEAFDCGLASRIVACGTGIGQALNFAKSLANMPRESLLVDRAALIAHSFGKYDESTRRDIASWARDCSELAAKRAIAGEHATLSGDVRRKN